MFEFVFVLIAFADVSAMAPLDLNLCQKLLFGIPYTISPKGGGNMGFFGGYSNGNTGYSNGYGSSFALIVVLFILLIIVGATFLY